MRRYLTFAAAVIFVLLGTLTALVFFVPASVAPFDIWAHLLAVPLQTPGGLQAAAVITFFGSTEGIIAGLVVIAALFRKHKAIVARMLFATIGAALSAEYLKGAIHRLRPSTLPTLDPIHSYSFPSGHSNSSMVLYTFLAVLLYMHAKTPLRRVLALTLPALLILLVGFSRIVLNYHYASDVLGGYLLGLLWTILAFSIPLKRRLGK